MADAPTRTRPLETAVADMTTSFPVSGPGYNRAPPAPARMGFGARVGLIALGVATVSLAFYAGSMHADLLTGGANSDSDISPDATDEVEATQVNVDSALDREQLEREMEQRSLVAVADHEQSIIAALTTGNFESLSPSLRDTLATSKSKLRQKVLAAAAAAAAGRSNSRPDGRDVGVNASSIASIEKKRRQGLGVQEEHVGGIAMLLHAKNTSVLSNTDTSLQIEIAVTDIGENVSSKFKKRIRSQPDGVVGSIPKRDPPPTSSPRNYKFEELMIEHPDLFTTDDLKDAVRCKSGSLSTSFALNLVVECLWQSAQPQMAHASGAIVYPADID